MIDTQQNTTDVQGTEVAKIFADYRCRTEASFPSIYSQGDVVALIDMIEAKIGQVAPVTPAQQSIDLDSLKRQIQEAVSDAIDGHDFDDNADFELSGREIRMEFNSRYLIDEVNDEIQRVFDKVTEEEVNN